jgi:hypothetical protein
MLGKYVDLKIFLISLAVGLFLVYIYHPQDTIIYVYPTPENVGDVIYRDKANTCYKFEEREVTCNQANIKEIPLQE